MRACILIIIMVTLTGCGSFGNITLTSRENDIIGEYAAGVLLKYDKNYDNRLVNVVEVETESVLEENEEETLITDVVSIEVETTVDLEASLNEALRTEKLIANFEGYFISDTYPEASGTEDEVFFSMKAVEGYKLLVLEFTLENPTDEGMKEDMLSKGLSYNLLLNGEVKVNSQLTMLLNDLSSYKEEIEAHSVKELVLIFQIPDRYENEDSISSMTLNIKDADESLPISLK